VPPVPPEREAPAEPLAGLDEPPAQPAAPVQTQPAAERETERSPGALALDLPALTSGEWTTAARRFLAVLEALDGEVGDRESLWTRLGFMGLTATTALVLFELGRQQLRKQRADELDLAFAGYPHREPLAR
jgi:hypothetical protein